MTIPLSIESTSVGSKQSEGTSLKNTIIKIYFVIDNSNEYVI